MGSLQLGMPSPAMIPANWNIIIIDLKDCFFTIPLAAEDTSRFAFSVPTENCEEPMQRYHWTVLPQGMKNSPTICQQYVATALTPIRQQYPQLVCYHYMDDILLAGKPTENLTLTIQEVINSLNKYGLQIAEEKVQQVAPWKYLGWKITERTIQPQAVQLQTNISTLNDLQKLLGNINWIRTVIGIDNQMLAPLFDLLRGDSLITSPRQLTPEARKAIDNINVLLTRRQSHRLVEQHDICLYLCNQPQQPVALVGQWVTTLADPLVILEWVFLPYQLKKTITSRIELIALLIQRGRTRICELAGSEPAIISIPLTQEYLDWCLQHNVSLQIALEGYPGELVVHLPPHKLFSLLQEVGIVDRPLIKHQPVHGVTVFTDGSGKTGKAALVWRQNGQWQQEVYYVQGSPQIVELHAVIQAFKRWPEPLNIVSDSQYVVGVVQRIERAYIKHISNQKLFEMFKLLLYYINHRTEPYHIVHIRSHTHLPGFLAEGNERADRLTTPVWAAPVPDMFQQARMSHSFFHQSARVLRKQFHLTLSDARTIVQACPDCQQFASGPPPAINPRGLQALQLWQTDVTHVPEFGRLKYVHVSVDTFSHVIWASAATGETSRHIQTHFQGAFAVLGIPRQIKTDNGPGYISRPTQRFFQRWGVQHLTGIPHSPTGQAIIERTHRVLKTMLLKQKGGTVGDSPQTRLAKAMYVLNHLSFTPHTETPVMLYHFHSLGEVSQQTLRDKNVPVMVKSLLNGKWEGPFTLITWGRGYACVLTDHGPRWVPARCVRPALTKLQVPGKQQTTEKDPEGSAETSEDILSDSANCFDGK